MGAIALVERPDGFYELDSEGDLHGPVSASNENDMPILSGAALTNASAARLLDCASIVVRAEAAWGLRISEMRVDREDSTTLFLDRPALAINLDFDRTAVELQRAARVLAIWRGHREMLAALDLTVPDQAIARLRPAAFHLLNRAKTQGTHRSAARVDSKHSLEVAASR
jgi:cell division septal protein FtsQ